MAWRVETAGSHESNYVAPLLDSAKDRGFKPETTALDMGYDNERVYGECEDRDSRPIIPLRETPAVKAGRPDLRPASMGSGGSLVLPQVVEQRSGGARPANACPDLAGSRRTAFTPWCRASRSAGSRSIEAAPQSSGSSVGSRMSGRCSRSACEGSSGSGSMPT